MNCCVKTKFSFFFLLLWVAQRGSSAPPLSLLADQLFGKAECNPTSLTAPAVTLTRCREEKTETIGKPHPDQDKNMAGVLETYRYTFIPYKITTKDGYILKVYRITGSPHYKEPVPRKRKHAVFIQHGLFAASDCWNFQYGNRNLPFKLADAGFEVWLGNARGTDYSLGHVKYNYDIDLEYWNFSWHEMGVFDLPAVIDTMIEETGNEKIFYIGHSMGTTMFFVAMSEHPEMNKKVHAAFMLSPVAYMGRTTSVGRLSFTFLDRPEKYEIVNRLYLGRVQNTQQFREKYALSLGDACDLSAAKCGVCDNLLFQLAGYHADQVNTTELPNMLAKFVHTVSVKTVAHYAQVALTCEFKKFDYGKDKNVKMYGSSVPPEYDLKSITVPQYFYYGDMDNMGNPIDVRETVSKFSPGVIMDLHNVDDPLWNHLDFLTGVDADKLVYMPVFHEIVKLARRHAVKQTLTESSSSSSEEPDGGGGGGGGSNDNGHFHANNGHIHSDSHIQRAADKNRKVKNN